MQIGETMVTEDVIYAEKCCKKNKWQSPLFIRSSTEVDKGYNSVRFLWTYEKAWNEHSSPPKCPFSTTEIGSTLLLKCVSSKKQLLFWGNEKEQRIKYRKFCFDTWSNYIFSLAYNQKKAQLMEIIAGPADVLYHTAQRWTKKHTCH